MPTFRAFQQHLDNLQARHQHFTLQMSFSLVVMLVGHIQLALRHPENNGPSADEMRRLAQAVIDKLDEFEPGFGALLEMGFDPRCDVSRTLMN